MTFVHLEHDVCHHNDGPPKDVGQDQDVYLLQRLVERVLEAVLRDGGQPRPPLGHLAVVAGRSWLRGGQPEDRVPLLLPLGLCEREARLCVLLRRLPPPPPVDGVDEVAAGQKGVEGLPEGQQAVVKAPHAEGGGVQQAVAVPGGGQRPEALAGPGVGPPVQPAGLLQ